uniref:Tetraspanin 34a n=1 Tax=Cyprinus carpio carpio TaxID=630221 RepID=A0A9J8AWK3_CYPCA
MCCKGFLKVMMFVFSGSTNFSHLAGAAILGVGIWVEEDRVSLLGILENIEDAPPELAQLANIGYVLIGVGAFLVLMGFLGCCRAVKGSKCMLVSFFSIMLIIFLVEVAAVIVLFVFKPLVRADALHHNKSTLKKLVAVISVEIIVLSASCALHQVTPIISVITQINARLCIICIACV